MEGGIKSKGFLDSLYSKKVEWEQKKSKIQSKIDAIENIEQNLSRKIEGKEISEMTEDERAWFLLNAVCVEELKASKVLSDAIWV